MKQGGGRRAGRLAELAVEAIDSLNELVTTQLEKVDEQARAREARLDERLADMSAILRLRTTWPCDCRLETALYGHE